MTRAVLGAGLLLALALPLAGQGLVPNDPLYRSRGSWGQAYDDQWGLKRIGFTAMGAGTSAWDLETGASRPVVVAVIDSGLDYFHPDLKPETVWRNPKEQPNGIDDDGNGMADCADFICLFMDPSCMGGGGGTGETSCTDCVDNDANGMIDCAEFSCILSTPACQTFPMPTCP